MGKWRRHAAKNEDRRQHLGAFLNGPSVVKNVLGHRKTAPRHSRINNAIHNSVEFVFLPEKKDDQDQSLGRFFDDGSRNYRTDMRSYFVAARRDHRDNLDAGVENESNEDR